MDTQEEQCPGKSRALGAQRIGEEHAAIQRHPPCIKCGADMGCRLCSGPLTELLCLDCGDMASKAGLQMHGHVLKGADRQEAINFLKSVVRSL